MADFQSIDPTTERVIGEYAADHAGEIDRKLDTARTAFATWRDVPLERRARALTRVADALTAQAERHAALITAEMGKPISDARSEIAKCAAACRFYAEHGAAMLASEPVTIDGGESWVAFDPLGPVLAVMPWNFPFWQVFRFAAPTLLAGNVALLKHASNVCGTALAIAEVFRGSDLPDGAFQTLLVASNAVADLIADDRIAAVTLTGSEGAGVSVATAAGRALKKCVLELGGSDAFIVLDDADLAFTATRAAAARTVNSGQSCIAAKRFIVVDTVADEFVRRLTAAMMALRVGDPRRDDTQVGPLARRDLREDVARQVARTVEAGGTLVCGGSDASGRGWFYAPTVLDQVRPGMAAFDEEVFGPVAAVVRVPDEEAALATANASRYGLGASVWTGDRRRAERLARRLESGMVFINDIVRSDPRLPFGGVKRSGYGRELSRFGLYEFVNIRSVVIGGDGPRDPRSVIE